METTYQVISLKVKATQGLEEALRNYGSTDQNLAHTKARTVYLRREKKSCTIFLELQSAQHGFQSEARTLASTVGEMARVSVNISDSPSSHPAESSCSRGSLGVQLCGGSGERPAAATTLRAVQCTACNSQASRCAAW